jgi:hypothetical protein
MRSTTSLYFILLAYCAFRVPALLAGDANKIQPPGIQAAPAPTVIPMAMAWPISTSGTSMAPIRPGKIRPDKA